MIFISASISSHIDAYYWTWSSSANRWAIWVYRREAGLNIKGIFFKNNSFRKLNTNTMNSTCKRLEFSSNKAFEIDGLIFYLGEYTIMDSVHNGEVVYRKPIFELTNNQKTYRYVYLHHNTNAWVISYEIATNKALFENMHCGRLRNPADRKCNGGWFYFDLLYSKWKYDSSMNMQCIEYF